MLQLDGKLITTLKYLIGAPGVMALDYARGKRVPYLKPLSLFLIANLLYFLLPSFDTFKSDLYSQMNFQLYSPWVESLVSDRLDQSGLTLEAYTSEYDEKTIEVSKLMIIVLAPLFGLIIAIMYLKKLFLTDAFNFALQFWSAFILFFMVPFALISYFFADFMVAQGWFFILSEDFLNLVTVIFVAAYLWLLLLRLKEYWLLKIGKVLVLVMCLLPIFTVYRAILFLVTISLI